MVVEMQKDSPREIRIARHAHALRAKERVDFDFSIASSGLVVSSHTRWSLSLYPYTRTKKNRFQKFARKKHHPLFLND